MQLSTVGVLSLCLTLVVLTGFLIHDHFFFASRLNRDSSSSPSSLSSVQQQQPVKTQPNYRVLHVSLRDPRCNRDKDAAKAKASQLQGLLKLARNSRKWQLDNMDKLDQLDLEARIALLHWAARFQNFPFASMMVDSGVHVDDADKNGWTALHWAAEYGQAAITRWLLDQRAKADAVSLDGGWTPLHRAASCGIERSRNPTWEQNLTASKFTLKHALVMELLIASVGRQGRKVNNITARGNTSRSGSSAVAAAEREYVNMLSSDGRSALTFAAEAGSERALEVLLKAGADVNITCQNGMTVLHYSVRSGNTQLVSRLLEAGATGGATVKDKWGHTALQLATRLHHNDMVKLLS